jgi:heme/copper-type cytochrome/quinol oxidase subunit 4
MDARRSAAHDQRMATPAPARHHAAATPSTTRLLIPLLAGAAVSVSLGVYGKVHDPTGRSVTTFGFSGIINMKVWLATIVLVLAIVQVLTALRLYGHLGSGPVPRWVAPVHRTVGTLAVVVSLPVAFHCLWSLGFSTYDTRTAVHSLLGCAFYGAFVAKMLVLQMRRVPGWALPLLGGLVFTLVVALWLTSSLWFFRTVGFPEF